MQALGRHVLLDLKDCDVALLDDYGFVKDTLITAARRVGATILDESFHKFQPQGVSGIVLIAESHISIHTWPENAYAAVDIFTCRPSLRAEDAVEFMIESFRSKNYSVVDLKRGAFVQERSRV